MFHEPVPPGQPRSLRSIAEKQNASSSFEGEMPYDAQAGAPPGTPGASGTYKEMERRSMSAERSDIPTPFVVTFHKRGGRK